MAAGNQLKNFASALRLRCRTGFQNDLKLLEQRPTVKMMEIEQRLTIKIGAMLAAAIGILLALEKLIK